MKVYYLFGEEITRIYLDETFENVMKAIKKGTDYTICIHNTELQHPSDLLTIYDGWGGYASITRNEYHQILKEE